MRSIIYFLLLFFTNLTFSQFGILKGRIFENINRNAGLIKVSLVLKDSNEKTYITETDLNGDYNFENMLFGLYSLKICCLGAMLRKKLI
jgi:hypothetical protein